MLQKKRFWISITIVVLLDAAIENPRRHDFLRCPDPEMPAEMRDPDKPIIGDWLPWRPITSTVTDEDIDELETHFGGTLPAMYVSFLNYVHFYQFTERGVGFERHIYGKWKNKFIKLYDAYKRDFPRSSHLVPFGRETFMDAGPVCFDFGHRDSSVDCPIVFWDHEWINTDKEIRPLFPSTGKMFETLLFFAKSQIDFLYHDPNYHTDALLHQKQLLLAEFLAIDANGAGGPAREYWTCWDVTPKNSK